MKIGPKCVQFAFAAAVIAPFTMSVLGHALGETASKSEASPRPALAFREYLLNLGRVPEGRQVPARFWFKNTGEKPLKILGFSPSCGCLAPQMDRSVFEPGEEGTFVVVADTASTSIAERADDSGILDQVKQHYVDVKYDAGYGEQFERIHLKFVLPARRVTVEPRALIVHQFNDQPTDREIVVTDRRSPPIVVTKVISLNPAVTVSSDLNSDIEDSTRARIAVRISDAKQSLMTAVRIHTNDPEQPILDVPIKIEVPADRPTGVSRPTRVSRSPLDLVPRDAVRRE